MAYYYRTINENEYIEVDSDLSKDNYWFERKKFINPTQPNNGNKFVFKNNIMENYSHIGEVAASIVGNKTIGNFCYCELAQREIKGFKPIVAHGVNSYFYYSEDDKLITPWYIINNYLKSFDSSHKLDFHDCDIETCLNSIKHYIISNGRTYAEFLEAKQQFINMMMFDCKFGNYDRCIENWYLYQNTKTGKISLYPLFDNEVFLGLGDMIGSFKLESNDPNSQKEAIKKYNANMRMKPFIPADKKNAYSSYEDILKYLLANYSYETIKAYKKIENFTLSDLEKLLEEFPDLPEEYKTIAKANFIIRQLTFNKVFKNINKDNIYVEKSLDDEV